MHRFGYWFVGNVRAEDAGAEVARPVVRYWLVWEGRQVPLTQGDNVLGRARDAEVWLDAPGVSRNHARITVSGQDATVEDLDSKNGTFVRGDRITTPCRLADGDQIRLGSVVVTFRIPPAPGSTDTVSQR